MAGVKGPRVKDEKTKKRKRDTNDSDGKPKKHRQQNCQAQVNGSDGSAPRQLQHGEAEASISQSLTTIRPQEVIGQSDDSGAGWRISKPMGGRMLDIDPILTLDEKHLILTYNTSLQIYSAADSLLVRRIPITTLDASSPKGSTPARIVATRLSKNDPRLVWVVCSDGNVYCVNWTSSETPNPAFQTASGTAKALIVAPASYATTKEILIIAESDKASRMDVIAYNPVDGSEVQPKSLLTLKKQGHGLQILESSDDGQVIVGAFQDQLFFGTASGSAGNHEDLRYEFFSFDGPDLITCIDLRRRQRSSGSRKVQSASDDSAMDVIVGGARGSIYIYWNAFSALSPGKHHLIRDGLEVRKHHWHRKAVHAVKWSRDGNYFISGGSENVLVLWQVDTAEKDFLPHLSGSIENIVVSAAGSSYVLHMDDNSAMVLSTAEMKPTAYIAGIQSAAVDSSEPKDLLVRRVWDTPEHVGRPIPAAIRPNDPSKLHVCVGNGRQAAMSGHISAPLLQSFDLKSFTSVSKQALARTQPTDVNLGGKGQTIDEPLVTEIAFSGDGRWLASVDEWRPADRDVENISSDLREQFIRERHEIYLKFWQVRNDGESLALVSRINAPHATRCPEKILGLASNPTSCSFATLGADGIARIWRPRPRLDNGVAVKDEQGNDAFSWACAQVIAVGNGTMVDDGMELIDATHPVEVQGGLTFSEDGSTLFIAFGAVDAGAVFAIDVASGSIVKTFEKLWDGKLQSIRALSSYIVVLSNDLRVHDVVGDELRYGIVVPKITGVSDLVQLAVDHTSGHFAVTLPIGGVSSIGVFDPENPEPLLVRTTPHRIVSLVSAPSTSGFIALDDAAQVWVVSEGSDPSSLATAQPLQDLQLDHVPASSDAQNKMGEALLGDGDAMDVGSEDELEKGDATDGDVAMADDGGDDDDDEINVNVIPQPFLTEIFDAAPAFAAPSIQDMFYKVAGLLATKPLAE